MTNFDALDANFTALSSEKLQEVEGGVIPLAVAASIIAGAASSGLSIGVTIGLARNKRK